MACSFEHSGPHEFVDVVCADGPVPHPPAFGRDFDQRLEPEHSASSVAHEFDLLTGGRSRAFEGVRYVVGAD
ncbi:hypothetical protein [Saccharopolyspora karakumensis]|uniref:hypothetical protein n=1 Tax=Saccharopolyspora karakumensis TaxID=2530386 RepID=UPI001F17A22F|nr:hypothetical protein [Saccharopolyspora karakumensis]